MGIKANPSFLTTKKTFFVKNKIPHKTCLKFPLNGTITWLKHSLNVFMKVMKSVSNECLNKFAVT